MPLWKEVTSRSHTADQSHDDLELRSLSLRLAGVQEARIK